MVATRPNVLFVFADQWRQQATGYNGDSNVLTPNIDAFAAESISFENAVAGCAVCSPFRASLMTGQYPLTHGVIVNDVDIISHNVPLAECFNQAGYDTGYIGKWHIDGHGRSTFVPPERRLGFQFWRGFECSHDYNHSAYYDDSPQAKLWEGYDAKAQTELACRYMREHKQRPFFLMLSWGPPHAPYETAPEQYRRMYNPDDIKLRKNVPEELSERSRTELAGYYAHCSALDDCFGRLLQALEQEGLRENTLVIFTSDHGDMLGSQGLRKKQSPWDESQRIPFLASWPARFGKEQRLIYNPIDGADIMPTLLDICGLDQPGTVEGTSAAPLLDSFPVSDLDGALLSLHFPFHQWNPMVGGREYRGIRTERFTYVEDLDGPWLLYDNLNDPYQLQNICCNDTYAQIQSDLAKLLKRKLKKIGDDFLPGEEYVKQRGIKLSDDKHDIPLLRDRSPVTEQISGVFNKRKRS